VKEREKKTEWEMRWDGREYDKSEGGTKEVRSFTTLHPLPCPQLIIS